jgi:hypothetical protein
MPSLLTQIKQVPVNSGYFVGIAATNGVLLTSDATYDIPIIDASGASVVGTLYKDLGKTIKLKGSEPVSSGKVNAGQGIYRKVVPVSEFSANTNPTERYIKLDGNTCSFARMG